MSLVVWRYAALRKRASTSALRNVLTGITLLIDAVQHAFPATDRRRTRLFQPPADEGCDTSRGVSASKFFYRLANPVQIVWRMGQMPFQPLLVLRLRHFKDIAWTTTNDQVSVIKDGVVIMPWEVKQRVLADNKSPAASGTLFFAPCFQRLRSVRGRVSGCSSRSSSVKAAYRR